jgi:hypothetical protein
MMRGWDGMRMCCVGKFSLSYLLHQSNTVFLPDAILLQLHNPGLEHSCAKIHQPHFRLDRSDGRPNTLLVKS